MMSADELRRLHELHDLDEEIRQIQERHAWYVAMQLQREFDRAQDGWEPEEGNKT